VASILASVAKTPLAVEADFRAGKLALENVKTRLTGSSTPSSSAESSMIAPRTPTDYASQLRNVFCKKPFGELRA
jgi:hypothetical protein